jgi:signal transduction histidine kinase/DNA-binding response OmpR family regulator
LALLSGSLESVRAQRRAVLVRYGFAVAAVVAALLLKLLLAPIIGRESPFTFFLAAVMVTAWYGGLATGLLATALSVPTIDFFFLDPIFTFDFGMASGNPLSLILFMAEGTGISLLVGRLYSAQDAARNRTRELQISEEELRLAKEELEFKVVERTAELQWTNGELQVEVTERQRAEEELRHAKDAAEAANRAKNDFLANVSHEIRNPMNVILLTTDLLRDTPLTTKQVDYLQMLKTSTHSLLSLLNDLLDFSKIEAGKFTLDTVSFNLSDRLDKTLKTQALRAHQKRLELACHVGPSVPEILIGDPNRLSQIITNLVGNAIKFTERGEVVVRVETISQSAEEVELYVTVSDTGIGIPADKQQAIFRPFEQGDSSTTRRFGGTGLGLSIAAELITLMGGRIWVESEVGRGSTFHFTARLGLSRSLAAGLLPVRLAGLQDVPILVIDDNATNRCILLEALRNWHMKPIAVDGMRTGLAVLKQALAGGEPFPLVLIDAHMPNREGFALAAHFRRQPGLVGAAILMLSSTDGPAEVSRCRKLGVAGWLTKPVLASELGGALAVALQGQSGETMSGTPAPPQATHGLRVLVTEDNAINQVLIMDLLEKLGHTVITAGNGMEALAAVMQHSFDAVLVDLQMPEMSGFEVTARIRSWEATTGTHVPIIAVTAYAMKGDRERCLSAGMDDYVAKPFQAQELIDTLARLTPTRVLTPLTG